MADAKKNLRDLTEPELKKELDTLVKALYALRTRQVTDVVEKSSQFSLHRRQIARIRTEMTARTMKIATTAPKAAAPAATPPPVAAAPKAEAKPAKVAHKPAKAKAKAAAKKPAKTPKKK